MPIQRTVNLPSDPATHVTPGALDPHSGSWNARLAFQNASTEAVGILARRRDREEIPPARLLALALERGLPVSERAKNTWGALQLYDEWPLAPCARTVDALLKYGPRGAPAWARYQDAPRPHELDAPGPDAPGQDDAGARVDGLLDGW